MKLIFITHPNFFSSQSMPRFASMLREAMLKKGYVVEVWTPKAYFVRLSTSPVIKKWLGYIDQYLIFPFFLVIKRKKSQGDSLFIFTDNALGPWMPYLSKYPHVVHCHDFMAQFSALGLIDNNPTSWTGQIYQHFIRSGLKKANNFISVSCKTQYDLHCLLKGNVKISKVIYNGLNSDFKCHSNEDEKVYLSEKYKLSAKVGYILHVGGNQWYKNRVGVIKIYNSWRIMNQHEILPLLLIGEYPNKIILAEREKSIFKEDIYFLTDVHDDDLKKAYRNASVFLFPSLMEGFGWPIIEAMASGCPVITTDLDPMKEVAGNAAVLIPVMPDSETAQTEWSRNTQIELQKIIQGSLVDKANLQDKGLRNVERFETEEFLLKVESTYKEIYRSYISE